MKFLRYIQRWLRGLGHSRGFGIQSPWAYALVTEVFCQRQPYYAYADLQQLHPDVRGRRLRLCQLYLRLANYRQEQPWAIVTADDADHELIRQYLLAGCRKTRVALTTSCPTDASAFTADDMLVVEGIHRDSRQHERWQQLMADACVVVSFDLLDCGICFFDPAKNRHAYVLNP